MSTPWSTRRWLRDMLWVTTSRQGGLRVYIVLEGYCISLLIALIVRSFVRALVRTQQGHIYFLYILVEQKLEGCIVRSNDWPGQVESGRSITVALRPNYRNTRH